MTGAPEAQVVPRQRAGVDDVQFERQPPCNIPAEQAVLGGMMLSKDVCGDVVEILHKGEDFYRPHHATVFDAIVRLFNDGSPVDMVTVGAALGDSGDLARIGGAPYLHTLLASVPTAANASYYARIVAEQATLRRLIEAGLRIVQLGYGTAQEGSRNVSDVAQLSQQAILEVTEQAVGDDMAVLSEMLQPTLDEIEAIGERKGQMTGVPTGFTDLDRLLNGLHPGQLVIVAGRPGLGKALALDTPLPTPDGWTTMGEVKVGDRLIGADGCPTTVTHAFEVRHDRPCYEVEFSDGSIITADAEHLWSVSTRSTRRNGRADVVVTTEQMKETLRTQTADQRLNYAVRNTQALAFPERDLPISPYTLGVWLGDGHSAAARFTTVDDEIIEGIRDDGYRVRRSGPMVYAILPPALPPLQPRECLACGTTFEPKSASVYTCGRVCGCRSRGMARPTVGCPDCGTVTSSHATRTAGRLGRCADCHARNASFVGALRTSCVLNNKHIPDVYLRASERQRRALLAGLLDTDGTVAPAGNVQYTTTSPRLAEDVFELVVSLGYRCTVNKKRVKGRSIATSTAYTLNFSTCDEVFRLQRKRETHKYRRAENAARAGSRYVVDVRPVPSVPVRCVTVDNPDHLYLAGRSMIPTHNSTASLDFARHAAVRANNASAIFSLEMSKVEIIMRMLSAEARVPLHVLRSGNLSDDDWTKLARCMGEIAEAPLFVDDTPSMNLMQVRAKAMRLKRKHDLKLIVVDYLQLMTVPKAESRQQAVSDLSRGLKLLAKEVECPVIAVCQLNRGPEQRTDKRPQLSDLRESGSLEQDADVVILLHRDDYYDKESARAGEADFIVAKHRNGPTDTITVAAQLHLSRFVDMAIG